MKVCSPGYRPVVSLFGPAPDCEPDPGYYSGLQLQNKTDSDLLLLGLAAVVILILLIR